MLAGGGMGGSWGRTVAARRVAGLCGCCIAGVRGCAGARRASGWGMTRTSESRPGKPVGTPGGRPWLPALGA